MSYSAMFRSKSLWLLALLPLAIAGCKANPDEFEGPSLQDLYGEFAINIPLTHSGSTDFAGGGITTFSAGFSIQAEWKIEITGLTTGAHKVLTGFGRTVNAPWDGSTTDLPVFAPETCAVMLTIANQTDTLRDTVVVLASKLNAGVLVADFETAKDTAWDFFFQSGINFDTTSARQPGQGSRYLSMQGTVPWDWLIGLMEYPARALDGQPTWYPLPANPNGVYFNCMVYGDATRPNTLLKFEFQEDDNGNGTWTEATEDRYDLEMTVDWTGWRLVSIPYSDLLTPATGGGANGDRIHNPSRLKNFRVLLLSNPTLGLAVADMDYLIFTTNGPLQP